MAKSFLASTARTITKSLTPSSLGLGGDIWVVHNLDVTLSNLQLKMKTFNSQMEKQSCQLASLQTQIVKLTGNNKTRTKEKKERSICFLPDTARVIKTKKKPKTEIDKKKPKFLYNGDWVMVWG